MDKIEIKKNVHVYFHDLKTPFDGWSSPSLNINKL